MLDTVKRNLDSLLPISKRAFSLLLNRNNLQYLILFVTARCNSTCPFCFYWQEQDNADIKNELSLEEIEKISKSMDSIEYLCLTGGEPFLRKDFTEICNVFIKNNAVKFISIPTTALMTKKIEKDLTCILKKFPNVGIRLTLSFNGIGDEFDKMHKTRYAFQKFLKTYAILQDLKSRFYNLDIQINSVYSSFTENKMEDLYQYVKESLHPDNYVVALLRGNVRETSVNYRSLSGYKKIMERIENDYYENRKKDSNPFQILFRVLHIRTREIITECLRKKRMPINCTAGKQLAVISETGKVFACELLDGEMGDLRKCQYDMKRILKSKSARKIRDFIKAKKCYCTWECAILNSLIFEPNTYPQTLWMMCRAGYKRFTRKAS